MEPTIKDVMTTSVVWVKKAARLMYTRQVKRLPVVDANGHLVGIAGRADLLAVFDRSDEDIRAEITDELTRYELLTDPVTFGVAVKDGVVTIEGVARTCESGHQIADLARHVQGVVAVRDRLDYPHPPEPPGSFDFDVLANFPPD